MPESSAADGLGRPPWKDLQAEFLQYAGEHAELAAVWRWIYSAPTLATALAKVGAEGVDPLDVLKRMYQHPDVSTRPPAPTGQWSLEGGLPASQDLFRVIAGRAAGRLPNHSDAETWRLWLDRMRAEGYAPEMPALGKSGQPVGPYPQRFEDRHIEHVFKVSADFCFARSLAEEATPNPVPLGTRKAEDSVRLAAKGAMDLRLLHSSPRVQAQYLKALAKLQEQLDGTWRRVFPPDARWPRETCEAFFGPFAQLGVALYDADAQELLGSTPSREQYLQALDFDLKTLVCERIYPYREKPIRTLQAARDADARGELDDEWTVRMREAWRLFEHPRHSAADDRVRREFIALDDADVWNRLIGRVHTAISKRVIHWLVVHAERVAALAEVGTTLPPATRGNQRKMGGSRCDPLLWRRFNHERASQTSDFRELLIYSFVSLTVPAGRTSRDVVEQIAREAGIPLESLSGDLNQPVYTRGQAIFGFAGDQFDEIACNYDNLQWWVSDSGLNMAIVRPAKPVPSTLQTPDFWRARRKEFDDLASRQRACLKQDTHKQWLRAYCDFSEESGEFGRCRRKGGLDGGFISEFEDVVAQAAKALGCPPDVEPVGFWLHCLGQDLLKSSEPAIRGEFSPGGEWGGYIQGLLESCAGYCSRLAAKAERVSPESPSGDQAELAAKVDGAPSGKAASDPHRSVPPDSGTGAVADPGSSEEPANGAPDGQEHAAVANTSERPDPETAALPDNDQIKRAKTRSEWLDQKLAQQPAWTSDLDIAGGARLAYNTIQRYRSGAASTRDLYVRRRLAEAFHCEIAEVPE